MCKSECLKVLLYLALSSAVTFLVHIGGPKKVKEGVEVVDKKGKGKKTSTCEGRNGRRRCFGPLQN